MNTKILAIIKKSRSLLESATPEQKIKFLKLIKQSLRKQHLKEDDAVISLSKNLDYIEEK